MRELHYNDVLGHIFKKHKEKVSKYLAGVTACDPTECGQAKRNNFWQWLCDTYPVTNGGMVWLDLTPIEAPAWVNHVFALIRKEFGKYTENGEIRMRVSW